MDSLFFIVFALLAGTAIKFWMKKSPLPYTVLLLLLGVLLGFSVRKVWLVNIEDYFGKSFIEFFISSLKWTGEIDPHVLLFVFLPILIFEASYTIDAHIFKKVLPNASLLAIPEFIIAFVISGCVTMWISYSDIGIANWNWTYSLMLGAVISATYPVAVVAILKEVDASKKLSSLIEELISKNINTEETKQKLENLIQGQTFIRNLKTNYPILFQKIVTRQAIR